MLNYSAAAMRQSRFGAPKLEGGLRRRHDIEFASFEESVDYSSMALPLLAMNTGRASRAVLLRSITEKNVVAQQTMHGADRVIVVHPEKCSCRRDRCAEFIYKLGAVAEKSMDYDV